MVVPTAATVDGRPVASPAQANRTAFAKTRNETGARMNEKSHQFVSSSRRSEVDERIAANAASAAANVPASRSSTRTSILEDKVELFLRRDSVPLQLACERGPLRPALGGTGGTERIERRMSLGFASLLPKGAHELVERGVEAGRGREGRLKRRDRRTCGAAAVGDSAEDVVANGGHSRRNGAHGLLGGVEAAHVVPAQAEREDVLRTGPKAAVLGPRKAREKC